ncbi:MAG: amidohydrolase family protein [Granulosicoccus sp.]
MIPLLDTHQHLIYPDIADYSWTDSIPELAHKSFTNSAYWRIASDSGIGATLFMEAGVDDADYQDEARYAACLAEESTNRIIGIVASCRPEHVEGFDAWLDECAGMPVVGFRRILHELDDRLSRTEEFRANVRKLGKLDLTFDMCFLARQLPVAVELARACDNTRLILDHCGVPDISGGEFKLWQRGISELAELPNVSCKLSGVMAYCAPGTASLATIEPYLNHVVNAFGSERLLWGSDWPVVNMANGLVDWIAVTRSFLDSLSDDEAVKLAHANASRIYQLQTLPLIDQAV